MKEEGPLRSFKRLSNVKDYGKKIPSFLPQTIQLVAATASSAAGLLPFSNALIFISINS